MRGVVWFIMFVSIFCYGCVTPGTYRNQNITEREYKESLQRQFTETGKTGKTGNQYTPESGWEEIKRLQSNAPSMEQINQWYQQKHR